MVWLVYGSRPVPVKFKTVTRKWREEKKKAVKKTSLNHSHLEMRQVQYTPPMLSEKSHSSNAISQSVLPNQVYTENVKEL